MYHLGGTTKIKKYSTIGPANTQKQPLLAPLPEYRLDSPITV